MRVASAVFIALLLAVSALAQNNINAEEGLKPYDTMHGGDIDQISMTNGGLALKVDLASFPQRGGLGLSFFVRFNSKQWVIKTRCVGVINPTCTNYWVPNRQSGTQIVSSLDWWMQNATGYDDPCGTWLRSVTSPDGADHQLGGSTCGGAGYPLRSLDATALYQADVHTIVMPNGTRYSYPNMTETLQTTGGFNGVAGYNLGVPPASVTDANGNQITINTAGSNIGWIDTLGRWIPGSVANTNYPLVQAGVPTGDLSHCPSGTASASVWNVPGLNGGTRTFWFCYSNVAIATNFVNSGATNYSGTWSVLTAVVLPDSTMWTFAYDSYGDITRLGFPMGGSISYTYAVGPITCSSGQSMSMWVSSRTVDANDGTGGHSWTYQYSTPPNTFYSASGTAIISAPDSNETVHTIATPVANTCSALVTQSQYFQGSHSGGTLLRTVQTQYTGNAGNGAMADDSVAINVVPTQVTTTVGSKTTRIVSTYDTATTNADGQPVIIGSLLQKDEYDFANLLVRSTVIHYAWQDNAAYRTNFVSLIVSTTMKDGNGNQVGQTVYGYDDPSRLFSSGVTMQHGGAPGSVRGNRTSVGSWLNTTGSFTTAYTNLYDTGMPYQTVDPLGHTTTYGYSSSFYGAYLTQTNMPDTGTVHHVMSGNYDFNTGLLVSFTDQNGQTSSYTYDAALLRLSTAGYPDGGLVSFLYPNPTTVERQKKITANDPPDDFFVYFDGLGRSTRVKHVTPAGNVLIDTTYDSVGRVSTVSNPYISTGEPTYGITTHIYDGLGRETKLIPPDGTSSQNNVVTTYSDNCTMVSDQANKQHKSCFDALGRVVEVDEPNPSAVATSGTGGVTISSYNGNGLDQSYTQSGAPGSGSVTISGTEQSAAIGCDIRCHTVWDSGTVSVTVNGVTVSTTYGSTATASSIASALTTAINGNGSIPVTATLSGTTISLTAKTFGVVTNYTLSSSVTSNDPNDFTPPSFNATRSGATLTGGLNTTTNWDTGTVTATINGTAYAITFSGSDTSSTIASRLAGAINGGTIASAVASGTTINLTSRATGSASNYPFSASYTWDNTHFTHPSFTTSTSGATFTGGIDAAGLSNNPLVTLYTYDLLGNLLCVEQHGGVTGTGCSAASSSDATSAWRVRRFTYDSLSRLLTATNRESGTVSWAYDNDSRVTSKTDARSVTITYAYDNLERVTSKSYSNGDHAVTYSYDDTAYNSLTITNGIGRQTGMTDATGASAVSYDAMGRVLIEQRTINIAGLTPGAITKQASYQYNLDASVKTITYPSGRIVNYSYDSAGQTLSATDSANNYVLSAAYLPIGALSSAIYGQSGTFVGVTLSSAYNNRLQPTLLSAAAPSATILSLSYCYNQSGCIGSQSYMVNNGDIVKITNNRDNNRSQNFTYDAINRIQSARTDGPNWGNTYTIDAWGNLTNINQIAGTNAGQNLQQSANNRNQFNGFSYDASGNLLSDGTHSFGFDAENRISCINASTCYYYDGNGERVAKTSGPLYWNGSGSDALSESDASGNLTFEYVFFNGRRVARIDLPGGMTHYYFQDHLGSTNVFTDSAGNIQNESDFFPYGGEISLTQSVPNQKFKFTGKERDSETTLDYFFARYYSSQFGRFMTPDWSAAPNPVPYASLANPQSLNLYAFVGNNPITGIDPDGHVAVMFSDNGVRVFTFNGIGSLDTLGPEDDRYDLTDANGHVTTIHIQDMSSGWYGCDGCQLQKVGSSAFIPQNPTTSITNSPQTQSRTVPVTTGHRQVQSLLAKIFSFLLAKHSYLRMPMDGSEHQIEVIGGDGGQQVRDTTGTKYEKYRNIKSEHTFLLTIAQAQALIERVKYFLSPAHYGECPVCGANYRLLWNNSNSFIYNILYQNPAGRIVPFAAPFFTPGWGPKNGSYY